MKSPDHAVGRVLLAPHLHPTDRRSAGHPAICGRNSGPARARPGSTAAARRLPDPGSRSATPHRGSTPRPRTRGPGPALAPPPLPPPRLPIRWPRASPAGASSAAAAGGQAPGPPTLPTGRPHKRAGIPLATVQSRATVDGSSRPQSSTPTPRCSSSVTVMPERRCRPTRPPEPSGSVLDFQRGFRRHSRAIPCLTRALPRTACRSSSSAAARAPGCVRRPSTAPSRWSRSAASRSSGTS